MVGDMGGWLLVQRFAMDILRDVDSVTGVVKEINLHVKSRSLLRWGRPLRQQ
jgi:hypothetical protein